MTFVNVNGNNVTAYSNDGQINKCNETELITQK